MAIDMMVGYPALLARVVRQFGGKYPVTVQRVDYFGNGIDAVCGPFDEEQLAEHCAKESVSVGPWRIRSV